MGLICLQNELFQGFNRAGFSFLCFRQLLVQNGLLGDERVLQFLEFGELKAAFRKGGVEPVDLCFEAGKFGFDAVDLSLPRLGFIILPELDLGEEFLFPVIGNSDQRSVALDLVGECFLPNQASVVGMGQFVFVRATVVVIPATASFGVALAGYAVSARCTGGKIEEKESLVASPLAGLADSDQSLLNGIERVFGNHWRVNALVQFALVEEDAIVEMVAEDVADG